MCIIGFAPLSRIKAGHLPIALVKVPMYNLVREKKPFPSLLFMWKFHQGSYLSPGKAGREENQEKEIIDGGRGWQGTGQKRPWGSRTQQE